MRDRPIPGLPRHRGFFLPWGQNRGQNPFTYSPRMAEFLEFFDRPMEPKVGFEPSVPRQATHTEAFKRRDVQHPCAGVGHDDQGPSS
jgi:hypothetical protein